MLKRNYFMIRAMLSREEDFEVFFKNNVVAVGWSEVNFAELADSKEVRDTVWQEYYANNDMAQQTVSRQLNAVERFKNLQKGDYVIIPYYNSIALAEVKDEEIYSPEAYEQDLANQRRVSYRYDDNGEVLRIPRNELTEGLQRRLRVPGSTIADLFEFKDEIEQLFSRKSYSYSQEMQEKEQAEWAKLKIALLENIQNGTTHLKAGGIGLEELVCELMQCEGYKAEILSKRAFSNEADADIKASKTDSFMEKNFLVQVKHHNGFSGEYGIQQVKEAVEQNKYKDCEGYFITSAKLTDDAKQYAEDNDIKFMDGNALVELIINNLDKLSATTKRLLGICTVPRIL